MRRVVVILSFAVGACAAIAGLEEPSVDPVEPPPEAGAPETPPPPPELDADAPEVLPDVVDASPDVDPSVLHLTCPPDCECPERSNCQFTCDDEDECRIFCRSGAVCDLICDDDGDFRITCALGASCRAQNCPRVSQVGCNCDRF